MARFACFSALLALLAAGGITSVYLVASPSIALDKSSIQAAVRDSIHAVTVKSKVLISATTQTCRQHLRALTVKAKALRISMIREIRIHQSTCKDALNKMIDWLMKSLERQAKSQKVLANRVRSALAGASHVSGEFLADQQFCVLVGCCILGFLLLFTLGKSVRRVPRPLAVPQTDASADAVEAHSKDRRDTVPNVMLAPTPLRSKRPAASPPSSIQRRRSDSPGITSANAASATSDTGLAEASSQQQDLVQRINSASREELGSLDGLGEKSILRIMSHRKRKGGIERVEDLLNDVGIHRATYANFLKAQGL
jgi:hypothetical protein